MKLSMIKVHVKVHQHQIRREGSAARRSIATTATVAVMKVDLYLTAYSVFSMSSNNVPM